MNKVAHHSALFLWRWRFPLAGFCVLVSVVASLQLASLSVSNSLDDWHPEDDPELLHYRQFQQTYGNDEIVVAAISRDDGFLTDEGIELVATLTDAMLDIDGIASVTSLVTVPQSLAAVRGRLLSDDGRTTALVLQMMVGESFETRRHQILLEVTETIGHYGVEARLAGYGVVFDSLNIESTVGTTRLLLMAHGLMILVLALFFRKPGPVLVILFAVGNATLWTMGLYVLLGQKLNMITMVLPTLILVIGIADCVHVLRSVAAQDPGLRREDRVVKGLAEVIGPCFLTSITTAAGFLALTASGLPAVQSLGWFGGVGVLAAYATAMVLCTAALSFAAAEPKARASTLNFVACRLCALAVRAPRRTIAGFAAVMLVSGIGIAQLETDTDSIGYLKKSHPVRQASDFVEATLGPYVPVEFTVSAAADIVRADRLDAISRWQSAVREMPDIGWSWSLVDALGVDPDERPSALGRETLSRRLERLRQFSPVTVAAMLSGDSEMRVSFGAPIMSARSLDSLIERIIEKAQLPADLELRPAGYSPLYTRIVDELVWSQVRGFSIAILLIVVLLGLALRSWRRTLLALPANVVPVAATLGLMGLAGIPLDVATATIATVILGLVVDDTVHILLPTPGRGIQASLRTAVATVGGTLLMTTVVLAAGFLVLGFAEIRSVAWFGVLTSFAMLVAIVTDLLLLPALASVSGNAGLLRTGPQVES